MAFVPALIVWAVIPFGAPMHTRWGRLDWVLADLPVGFLFILAIASLGVYGIVLAGWASNNKYSLLGGLRSSAQMVSYEISMGMSTIPVLLLAGNVALNDIVQQQAAIGWNVLNLTIAFFVFLVAAFAETNRLPFDLPEAESELITGYHTEYSSMKFSMFFIAEYANMLTASAQMISYEVAMGLSLIPVLLMSGNVSFSAIIQDQQAGLWYVLPLFLSFFVFLISGFAETNRLPFDLPEAESELIAGYHTEYSAMKFSFFFIAEYANVVTVCAMVTTLFFGGWDIPGRWDEQGGVLQTIATGGFFFLKLMFWIFFVMWIRWTLPRFRYDQLMALGWKVLMPLALAYIMVTCTAIYAIEHLAGIVDPKLRALALFGVNMVVAILVFGLLDSNVFIKGSNRRQRTSRALEKRATVTG